MGQSISLSTRHGRISGWMCTPPSATRSALVVVQEIFGVNAHIRQICERFARHGYVVIAPALFDLVHPHTDLGYDEAGITRGREISEELGFNGALDGVRAAYDQLGAGHRVGIVGYCWGGSVAFLANAKIGIPAVSYYGGRTVPMLKERLKAPMMFHFGQDDPLIPPEDVQKHCEAQPNAEYHLWPAGHGFNCDQRADYNAEVASQALSRTLGFFQKTLR